MREPTLVSAFAGILWLIDAAGPGAQRTDGQSSGRAVDPGDTAWRATG